MENIKNVHCLFEQSGTFKNVFKELGYDAMDYDLKNEFGETDNQIDIFQEIQNSYNGGKSIFDNMGTNDLLIAFFPCTYFEVQQRFFFQLNANGWQKKSMITKIDYALDRNQKRTLHFEMLYKLLRIIYSKKIKAVIENPWTLSYLEYNFIPPSYIDRDRTRRGDFFKKCTAYWFFNMKCGSGFTKAQTPRHKIKPMLKRKGEKERSMISKEYAKNFICDQILKTSPQRDYKQLLLFEDKEG